MKLLQITLAQRGDRRGLLSEVLAGQLEQGSFIESEVLRARVEPAKKAQTQDEGR